MDNMKFWTWVTSWEGFTTFKHDFPHGTLFMVCKSGYGGAGHTVTMQFVPNPPHTEGVYR